MTRGPVAVGLAYAVAYAVFLGVPYVANRLYLLPWESAVRGLDLHELWPFSSGTGAVASLWAVGAFFTVWWGLLISLAVLFWALAVFPVRFRTRSVREDARAWLGVLLGSGLVWFQLSPVGQSLFDWIVD